MHQTIENFYHRHSRTLLVVLLLSLPVVAFEAAMIKTNNNVETWLPAQSELKLRYDRFREDFGSEELILIGLKNGANDSRLVSAMAGRLENLEGIRRCWDSEKLRQVMTEFQVPEEAIQQRLVGVTESEEGDYLAIMLLLSEAGTQDRIGTVNAIREELEYCQLREDQFALAGSPVVTAELDRLGGPKNNRKFFLMTIFIGFQMVFFIVRDWRLSAAMMLLVLWAIQATTMSVKWCAGEMNFILGALPVMVMVFTLAISIHVLHYYDAARKQRLPLATGLLKALKPCLFACLTTTIGLASLCLSDIMPVRQFGYAASLGCMISMVTAIGMTPALVVLLNFRGFGETKILQMQRHLYDRIIAFRRPAALTALVVVLAAGTGLPALQSRLEPLDFLPENSKVLADIQEVQQRLTTLDSIEVIVDFDTYEPEFLNRMDHVRKIEAIVASHPLVRRTSSPASFFPTIEQMPEGISEIGNLLKSAQSQAGDSDYVACGQRFWRISARIEPEAREAQGVLVQELRDSLAGYNVSLTGLSPLIKQAQYQIFDGFWSSFLTAFLIISAVMMIALRSITTGLFAMIPNLTPLMIVFGLLAWWDIPIDIGMMMTGSIALGIAVDGTFHLLVKYQEEFRQSGDSKEAATIALRHTGPPIAEAAIIAAVGMLALGFSQFAPTARFGLLMSALLVAALIGDLVLLPAMLAMRPGKKKPEESATPTPIPAPAMLGRRKARRRRNVEC